MKGVLLCGGTGTRLAPLTKVLNKHLLPVGPEPMFFHPLRRMVEAGLLDIAIVCGGQTPGAFMELAGDGSQFGEGVRLTYQYQEKPAGVPDALRCALVFDWDDILVMLGDTILGAPIKGFADEFLLGAQGGVGARIMIQEVPDPERCGVLQWDADGNFLGIVEKPTQPAASSEAIIGAYCFDHSVWSRLRNLRASERGELEIVDVLNSYLRDGRLICDEFAGPYADAGTWPGYREANRITWAQWEACHD
jgi:glucose-1-phosphate thymidylyltransferase